MENCEDLNKQSNDESEIVEKDSFVDEPFHYKLVKRRKSNFYIPGTTL